MKLDEILDAYMTSTVADWHGVDAPLVPETHAHERLFIYKPNIAIAVARGHGEEELHTWSWVEVFPDRTARNFYIDVLYHGVPVYRQLAVSVDGGRAELPSPSGYVDNEESKGWRVERSEYEFVRQFSVICGRRTEFDQKFEQATRGAKLTIM